MADIRMRREKQVRPGTAHDIVLGEPLEFPIHDADGTLLLSRGMVVATEQQLDRLLARGFKVPLTPPAGATHARVVIPPPPSLRHADVPVFDAVRDIAARLHTLHQQLLAQSTAPDFADAVTALALQVDDVASRDADAALASMQLLGADEESFVARFVHGAVLCRVFAMALDLDERQRLSVLAAALTYDVALVPVSRVLNRQHAPLTPEQRRAIDAHPRQAYELLRAAGVEDPTWLAAVLEHHERVDGSGYPDRLSGERISLAGRVIGIVDTFSAMVRPRAYRDAVLCRQALRDIFLARSKSVDERLAHLFVREIGMYPPGSLLRLASREVAVVVRRGPDATHPQVCVVMEADSGRAVGHRTRDTRQPGFEIVEGIALHKYPALQPAIHRLWRGD